MLQIDLQTLPNPRSSTTQSPRTTITTIIRITILRSIWCTPRDLVNTIKHHHRHPSLSLILMQEGLPPVLRGKKKKKSTRIHPIYSRDQCSYKKQSCSLLLQTLPPSSLPTLRKLANELRPLTSSASSPSSSSSSPPLPIVSCCEYLETRDQRGTKVLPAHPRQIKEASWEDTHTPTGTRNYSVRFRNTPINPPFLSSPLPPFPSLPFPI